MRDEFCYSLDREERKGAFFASVLIVACFATAFAVGVILIVTSDAKLSCRSGSSACHRVVAKPVH